MYGDEGSTEGRIEYADRPVSTTLHTTYFPFLKDGMEGTESSKVAAVHRGGKLYITYAASREGGETR